MTTKNHFPVSSQYFLEIRTFHICSCSARTKVAMAKIESVYLPNKSMAGAAVAVGGGGNKHKSPSSSSSRSSPSLSSSSEDLRCSFCSKHFTRKLDLAHHLEDMHCRERCLYGKCGAVFTGKHCWDWKILLKSIYLILNVLVTHQYSCNIPQF